MPKLAKKMGQVFILLVDDLLSAFTSQMRGLYVPKTLLLYNPFGRSYLQLRHFLALVGPKTSSLYHFYRTQSIT